LKSKSLHNSNPDLTQLAAQLANGNAMAIAQIYKQTYNPLLYFGLQVVGKHQQVLVEETIQELFIWLAKNYQQVGTIQHFEAYLYQSLRRNLKQHLQNARAKQATKNRFLQRTKAIENRIILSPEEQLLNKEQTALHKAALDKKIAKLPTYQKEVLYLRFYENRSYKEIAELLSINGQVARNYVFRALSVLRKQMNKLPFLFF